MSSADIIYMQTASKLLAELETQRRTNRTDTATAAIFGVQMRFNLKQEFPILTTKQVHFPSVVSELLWFLKGDTNIKYLLEHNNHIWTDWRYKAYLHDHAKRTTPSSPKPLSMAEFENLLLNDTTIAEAYGNIGKGYGHQWRNFGELDDLLPYSKDIKYQEGFDQISWVINEIKTNPTSRRLIVSGWNPHEVNQVDLPPCHTLFQFFVKDGKLSCQLYQRSADYFLGVPFNIASYALLTHLVARECGLGVGEFIWVGGDTHLYENHEQAMRKQQSNLFKNIHYSAPTLSIQSDKSIFDLEPSDISLINYQHAGKIPAPVAV